MAIVVVFVKIALVVNAIGPNVPTEATPIAVKHHALVNEEVMLNFSDNTMATIGALLEVPIYVVHFVADSFVFETFVIGLKLEHLRGSKNNFSNCQVWQLLPLFNCFQTGTLRVFCQHIYKELIVCEVLDHWVVIVNNLIDFSRKVQLLLINLRYQYFVLLGCVILKQVQMFFEIIN